MSPISNTAIDHTSRNTGTVNQVQAVVEVSYCDVSKVRTFAVSQNALPVLSPGDQIYLRSGGAGAYRTVLRVEPIADGAVMVFLEPSRAEKLERAKYGNSAPSSTSEV